MLRSFKRIWKSWRYLFENKYSKTCN